MHFVRLVRPVNLIIIALTMYGLGWFYHDINPDFGVVSLPFLMLTVSTVMIAAAGNIINDYFDIRADRVNKPDRLIIGVHIKKRVAIVTHWGINLIAFSIAIYLSYTLQSFWYVFIHLFSINFLWFYSVYFKRRFAIGNIVIAALTALVPILVGIYFFQTMQFLPETTNELEQLSRSFNQDLIFVVSIALSSFAFILNLAREMVKDIEDVEGDKLLKAKTLPITIGSRGTKWIAAFLLLSTIVMAAVGWWYFDYLDVKVMIPLFASGILILVSFILLLYAQEIKAYKRVNLFIKLSMTAGLLAPVFWKIIEINVGN